MTKLPAKLFCDFGRNGALARILCCALRYKNEQVYTTQSAYFAVPTSNVSGSLPVEMCIFDDFLLSYLSTRPCAGGQGWKSGDFEKKLRDPAKRQEHITLFQRIEMDLLNAQLLR